LLVVDILRTSRWPSQELKHAIQRVNPNFLHYCQTILHIDPLTNEPYTACQPYREDSILCLVMTPPDVYIKESEHFLDKCLIDKQPLESILYTIHVYAQKRHQERYAFIVNRRGIHLFGFNETYSKKPWTEYIFGKSLPYQSSMYDAICTIPDPIRDEIIRKWELNDIMQCSDRLPHQSIYDEDEEGYH
jgi:hypothetical protein